MYCMFCGKKNDYGVCKTCSQDKAKVNAHLREMFKQPWVEKSMSREFPELTGLYFLPDEARSMTSKLLDEEGREGAQECLGFGIYAVLRYKGKGGRELGIVDANLSSFRFNRAKKKMLFLLVAKHFEEMAEIEK